MICQSPLLPPSRVQPAAIAPTVSASKSSQKTPGHPPLHVPAAEQVLGGAQSALVAQPVAQTPLAAVAAHRYGAQEIAAGATQVPLPSQAAAGVSIDVEQRAAAHVVPDAYFWQAPLPLQAPLVPQLAGPWSAH